MKRRVMIITDNEKEYIRGSLLATGAEAAGFAAAEDVDLAVMADMRRWLGKGYQAGMDYLELHAELKSSPSNVLDGAATVISVAFSYAPREFRRKELPTIACYAYGDDYHDVLRDRLTDAVADLKSRMGGEWRICIDSAPLPERYWALKCGIGCRGKNGSVIVDNAGGYVFLAEILTTLTISPDEPSVKKCLNCGACVKACPQHALHADGSIDSRRCLNYLTIEHKGDWEGDSLRQMQTQTARHTLFGCDICLRVCPHNRHVAATGIREFQPREALMEITAEEAAAMTQEEFSTMFRKSAVKRCKLAGLRRNALNAIGSGGMEGGNESSGYFDC